MRGCAAAASARTTRAKPTGSCAAHDHQRVGVRIAEPVRDLVRLAVTDLAQARETGRCRGSGHPGSRGRRSGSTAGPPVRPGVAHTHGDGGHRSVHCQAQVTAKKDTARTARVVRTVRAVISAVSCEAYCFGGAELSRARPAASAALARADCAAASRHQPGSSRSLASRRQRRVGSRRQPAAAWQQQRQQEEQQRRCRRIPASRRPSASARQRVR